MAWTAPGSIWLLKSGAFRPVLSCRSGGRDEPAIVRDNNETTLIHGKTKAGIRIELKIVSNRHGRRLRSNLIGGLTNPLTSTTRVAGDCAN